MRREILIALLVIVFLSCSTTPAVNSSPLTGTWVMDEGEAGYIDIVGFKIHQDAETLQISFGEIVDGNFDAQEGPILLESLDNMYVAEYKDTRFQIQPDRTGIVFLGFSDGGSKLYHFRPLK